MGKSAWGVSCSTWRSAGVVGEQVELSVAVGTEVNFAAEPHGVRIVAATLRLRDLHDGVVRHVVQPDA